VVVRPGSPLRASWATVNRQPVDCARGAEILYFAFIEATSPVVAIRVTRENGGQLTFDAFRGQSGESGIFSPALMEGTVETDPPAEGEVMSEAGFTPTLPGPSRVRLVKAPALRRLPSGLS
jgi:hypothetical protein